MKSLDALCAAERYVVSSASDTSTFPDEASGQEFQLNTPSSAGRVLKKSGEGVAVEKPGMRRTSPTVALKVLQSASATPSPLKVETRGLPKYLKYEGRLRKGLRNSVYCVGLEKWLWSKEKKRLKLEASAWSNNWDTVFVAQGSRESVGSMLVCGWEEGVRGKYRGLERRHRGLGSLRR